METYCIGFGILFVATLVIGVGLEIYMRVNHPEAHLKMQSDVQKVVDKFSEVRAQQAEAAKKQEEEKKNERDSTAGAIVDIFANIMKKRS